MAGGLKRLRRELLLASPHLETAEGESASFETDLVAPIKSCLLEIEPVQTGSGTPSPENIRPLAGRTGLTLTLSPTQDAQDGESLTVSWADGAGEVFGGSLDLTTGLLTVSAVKRTILSVSGMQSANNGYAMSRLGNYGYVRESGRKLCSMLAPFSGSASRIQPGYFNVINSPAYNRAQLIFKFADHSAATKAEAAAMYEQTLAALNAAGTPLEVVFTLAEPLTWQLTSAQVLTLRGMNRVFSDAGAVSLRYWTH